MQGIMNDVLAILFACLAVAGLAGAILLFRPSARKHRRRERRTRRPKIDLFKEGQSVQVSKLDA